MCLEGRVVGTARIDPNTQSRMFDLMGQYYDNVDEHRFLSDLSQKQKVILLEDEGVLVGFSTQESFWHPLPDNENILVVYSGDTILMKPYWGTTILSATFMKWIFSLEQRHPNADMYWLLTTKGYMTYRFLPVFFKTFFPNKALSTPLFETKLVQSLVRRKFPDRHYLPDRQVLKAARLGQKLKPEVAGVENAALRNKDVAFFDRTNPGHAIGDELVCITRCNQSNVKSCVLKRIRR